MLLKEIRRHYSTNYGCLVRFHGGIVEPIFIAIGCISNEGLFVPKYGKLWRGKELLMETELTDPIILRYINHDGYTIAEITDTMDLAMHVPGLMLDLRVEVVTEKEVNPFKTEWNAMASLAKKKLMKEIKHQKKYYENYAQLCLL